MENRGKFERELIVKIEISQRFCKVLRKDLYQPCFQEHGQVDMI